MNTTTRTTTTQLNQNRRGGRLLLIGIAVFIAGLFALPTTAEAHGKHDRGRGHHARKYNHHGYDRVPHRITARHHQQYGHYYSGRSYDRRHRHHNSVYRFPVFIDGRPAHRSYSYCGDSLYLRRGVRLPRLAFGLAFGGRGGFYLQGSYRSRYHDGRHHDDYHDDDYEYDD